MAGLSVASVLHERLQQAVHDSHHFTSLAVASCRLVWALVILMKQTKPLFANEVPSSHWFVLMAGE